MACLRNGFVFGNWCNVAASSIEVMENFEKIKNFSAEISLNRQREIVKMGKVGVCGDDKNKRHTAPVKFFGESRVSLNTVSAEEVHIVFSFKQT